MHSVKSGETVYLIYAGLVTVQSVDNAGNISFYLYDDVKLETASKSMYRILDRLSPVNHPSIKKDYTKGGRLLDDK